MDKFLCNFAGERWEYLSQSTPESIKKVNTLASLMIISISLWFISSYLFLSNIVKVESWVACVISFIPAFFILLIERSIVSSNSSTDKWNGAKLGLFLFRLILSIISALICAIAIDDSIYNSEIKQRLIEENTSTTLDQSELKGYVKVADSKNKLDRLNKDLKSIKATISITPKTDNSRRNMGGYSADYESLNLQRIKLEKQIASEESSLESYKDSLETQMSNVKAEYRERSESSILKRLRVLFEIVTESFISLIIYILFSLFILFLELCPLVFKYTFPKTKYEKELNERELFGSELEYQAYKNFRE